MDYGSYNEAEVRRSDDKRRQQDICACDELLWRLKHYGHIYAEEANEVGGAFTEGDLQCVTTV